MPQVLLLCMYNTRTVWWPGWRAGENKGKPIIFNLIGNINEITTTVMTAIKGKKRVETGNTHFALRPRIPRVFFCVSPLFRRCSVYLFRPRYSNYRIHVQQSSLKKKLFFLFFFISQKRNKYVCCLRTHDLI